jgi:hypothetical protein
MTGVAESFVVALARASKRGSYHLRRLRPADRDDVIATALAWCWENRSKYDPSFTLEKWFDMALKDARARFFGGGSKRKKVDPVVTAVEFNEGMARRLPDAAEVAAEMEGEVKAALRKLTLSERQQIYRAAMDQTPLPRHLRAHLAIFRKRIPRRFGLIKVLRTASAVESDFAVAPPARIDVELARIGAPGLHGADCPPCWRCKWYYGYAPIRYSQRVTVKADPEVQAAIWATEARKIEIAAALQAGALQFIGVGAQ